MKEENKSAVPGNLDIKEIEEATRAAALVCYGVVAIVKRDKMPPRLADWVDSQINKKGIPEDAIFVRKRSNRTFSVDVYLVLSNEVKITEALVECQKNIMYILNKKFDKACTSVNVYGEEILAS
ncbi:MAG TPA: Asp23/Gls24 family envelope stress response protein [Erysipelotrichaceae bacterium]|nr:Asp23/Gls24 family envelope stress response protein [Erysipelotrichaceae bacterium]